MFVIGSVCHPDFVPYLLFLSVLAGNTGQHALKLVMIVCNITEGTIGLLSSYQSSKHVIFLELSGVLLLQTFF